MTAATTRSPPEGSVLRFAIAMRGGVSLAVWIGGAFSEIDGVRDPPSDGFSRKILAITRFARFEVDILTGASAGGLNAALGGLAIAKGAPMALRQVWLGVADIDQLLGRSPGRRLHSLLNGDYFLGEVEKQLQALDGQGRCGRGRPVELFLATTLLGGVQVTDPTDPGVRDPRRGAYFHFRHLAAAQAFSDLDPRWRPEARLARAARSTASFPAAFEPVKLTVGEFDGRLLLPTADPRPTTLRSFDGGILDNIPVARAIKAAALSPAQDSVRRWVVFLHPSPGTLGPAPSRSVPDGEPSLIEIAQDVVAGRGAETLLDDLEALRAHNRESESQRLQRYSLCKAAFTAMDGEPGLIRRALAGAGINLPEVVEPASGAALASVDADRLYALLDDPASGGGWVPIGQEPRASPLIGKDDHYRFHERMRILEALDGQPDTVRPFARLLRIALFIVEWIRSLELSTQTPQRDLRRKVYDVVVLAQLLDAFLESAFLEADGERMSDLETRLGEVRRSAILQSLVSDAESETVRPDALHLRDRLSGTSQQTLDALAGGTLELTGEVAPADPPALDGRLLDRLAGIGVDLVTATPGATMPPRRNVFELLYDRLQGATADRVRAHLIVLDVACAGFHRGHAAGVPMALDYYRLSGAAPSPLAGGCGHLGATLPTFAGIINGDQGINPKTKLSGNSLGNFSAFVSPRFRANDWMWGRLDAAAGMVDILLRPEYLAPDAVGKVQAALEAPFDMADSPLKASGEEVCRRLKASGEEVCRELWRRNGAIVAAELTGPANGEHALSHTRELVTARWQLEIFLKEVGAMFQEPLQPGGAVWPMPALRDVEDGPGAFDVARSNLARVMASYEKSPRRVSHVWGEHQTTALGVRVARAAASAVVPGDGVVGVVERTLLAIPLMLLTAAALTRGAFVVASAILLNTVLVPRLATAAAAVTVVVAAGATLWLFRKIAGPDHGRWRRRSTGVVALAAYLFGASTVFVHKLRFSAPPAFKGAEPWDVGAGLGWPMAGRMLAVGVLVALATALLWNWAKPAWRAAVALVSGGILALWVPVGAWTHPGRKLPLAGQVLSTVGSMWVPALALVLAATRVTMHRRPEKR